jgi:hypothetical protein
VSGNGPPRKRWRTWWSLRGGKIAFSGYFFRASCPSPAPGAGHAPGNKDRDQTFRSASGCLLPQVPAIRRPTFRRRQGPLALAASAMPGTLEAGGPCPEESVHRPGWSLGRPGSFRSGLAYRRGQGPFCPDSIFGFGTAAASLQAGTVSEGQSRLRLRSSPSLICGVV